MASRLLHETEDHAEAKTGTGAAILGREEWDEQVRQVGNSRTIILHPHFQISLSALPADAHTTARFQRRIHRVAQQVDQELLELIAIALNFDRGAWPHYYR